jgi:hypothetical protein
MGKIRRGRFVPKNRKIMKSIHFLIMGFFLIPLLPFAQNKSDDKTTTTDKKDTPQKGNDYAWSKRVSFIAGGGLSVVTNKLYQDPIVDKTNNFVKIEELQRWKPNLTLGISYTPFLVNAVRKIKTVENEKEVEKTLIEYYPKGITFSLFLNPFSVSKLSENSLSNTVDLGLGIGYRSDNFSFLVTSEFFSIRQPRDYFVKKYSEEDLSYIVDGQIQKAFDINDNTVFTKKVAISFGIKFAYTFDIIRSFYANSQGKSN